MSKMIYAQSYPHYPQAFLPFPLSASPATDHFQICTHLINLQITTKNTHQSLDIFCGFVRSRGLSSGRKRLGVASYEGAEYILTVRETAEHFCEPCEQKFYIRRPNKSENLIRDRIKEKWLNCCEAWHFIGKFIDKRQMDCYD